MTNIVLPKDAEGREIPLDTTVLYSAGGKEYEIDTFTYSPSENIWRAAFVKGSVKLYTCDLYLTPVVVLCADGKPVDVGDTVYCDDSPEPLTVTSFIVNECGPVSVKSAGGGYYTVPAGRLTHERPDSWEKLEEDLGRGVTTLSSNDAVCDYFDRGSGYDRCKGCPAGKRSSCTVAVLEDVAARIRKLRGED